MSEEASALETMTSVIPQGDYTNSSPWMPASPPSLPLSALSLLNHTDRWTPEGIQRVVTLSLLMVVTLIGNVTLIVVLASSTKYRTLNRRVNIFIVNLAAGDLTVCSFTMTSEVLFVVHEKSWVLGDGACRVILYVQIVTLASTTFILTAMSIDRYLVVSRPLRYAAAGGSRATKMIVVSWIMALIFAAPQVIIWKQVSVGIYSDGQIKYECASRGYSAWWQRKAYFTVMAMYILVVPTSIISFCYLNVVRAVWRQTKLTPVSSTNASPVPTAGRSPTLRPRPSPGRWGASGSGSPKAAAKAGGTTLRRERGISKAKIQTIKMTLCIICSFIACWTPYFVVHLVYIWSEYSYSIPQAVIAFADTIALLNSAMNPILYACFTVKLKRGLRDVFCNCLPVPGSVQKPTRLLIFRRSHHHPAPPQQLQGPPQLMPHLRPFEYAAVSPRSRPCASSQARWVCSNRMPTRRQSPQTVSNGRRPRTAD